MPVSAAELARHASPASLWLAIAGQAYDLTDFDHPGGPAPLLKHAGADATAVFEQLHPPGTLDTLEDWRRLGPIEGEVRRIEETSPASARDGQDVPRLEQCISLDDFEIAAHKLLSPKGWAYCASSTRRVYEDVILRPRVLRDVRKCDTSVTLLGKRFASPFFVSPAAMAKLSHPDGEVAIARACGQLGLLYILSSNASSSIEEVARARVPGQTLWWQLYINRDRAKTEAVLRKVEALGYEAIVLTVDAPVGGKRELDERHTLLTTDPTPTGQPTLAEAANDAGQTGRGSVSQSTGAYFDMCLQPSDIAWIKSIVSLPVVIKGVQTAEDAQLCVDAGAAGLILSNHGGRQLEAAPTALETLLEIRRYCPDVLDRCDVLLDGSVRRGSHIVKALALGAKACGLGRPALYSLVFGEQGVRKMGEILKAELESNMRLVGVSSVHQLGPRYVNAKRLEALVAEVDMPARAKL